MAGPSDLGVSLSFVGELVGATLVLSTIEYAIIGLLIGRAFHGKRLRQLARHRGWEWHRGDPERRIEKVAPRILGPRVRARRVRFSVHGDTAQAPFTLWVYRNRRRDKTTGRHTVLAQMAMPRASPGLFISPRAEGRPEAERYAASDRTFLEQMWSEGLAELVRDHPELAWDWTGDRIVVSSDQVKTMDDLQALTSAVDKFRALTPDGPAAPARAAAMDTTAVTA